MVEVWGIQKNGRCVFKGLKPEKAEGAEGPGGAETASRMGSGQQLAGEVQQQIKENNQKQDLRIRHRKRKKTRKKK